MTLNEILKPYQLILGSASPRRQQLLRELGLNFSIKTADTEEHAPANFDGFETAIHIAKEKAAALSGGLVPENILITADTEVWQNKQRFGKPENLTQARKMLLQLSGNVHKVISGVCFTTDTKQHCFSVATDVYFRKLTHSEIDYYLQHGNPLDKAGAYGIQEWIGLVGIERIEGSYTNVVGMPMTEFYTELEQFITSLT